MYRRNLSGKLKKVVMSIRLSILLLLSRPFGSITKWYWNRYMNGSIFVIVIGSFFILRSECFITPTSLSYWLNKKEFICSTVRQTVFVLFASQLTAALPFSMRTSSFINVYSSWAGRHKSRRIETHTREWKGSLLRFLSECLVSHQFLFFFLFVTKPAWNNYFSFSHHLDFIGD